MYWLFYLDRVQFCGEKVDRWFPTAINWTTEMVSIRGRDKKLLGEYERGRIIERIDYHNIEVTTQTNLHKILNQEYEVMQQSTTPPMSATTIAAKCPHCPHCTQTTTLLVHEQVPQVYYHP